MKKIKTHGYRFKEGSTYKRRPADTIARVLLGLGKGGLSAVTPEAVVAEARKPGSPLSGLFEWDDGRAAELHRLEQARHLLRSIDVTVVDSGGEEYSIRAFVTRPNEPHGGYVSTVRALSDRDTRQELVERAKRELISWKSRYEILHELAEVFSAIDVVTKETR